MAQSQHVGVVGLGSMGFGMAQSLLRAGHSTFGFDLSEATVARFCAQGGQSGPLAEVVPKLETLVLVVLNGAQAEAVLFGDVGVAAQLPRGAVIIACPTIAPDLARSLESRVQALGLHYLDAPISGGAVKAAQGALTIMAAGTPDAFAAARPALDAMAETVFELGDAAGPGSAMKSVNQMLAGVHIAAMAEAMTFGMTQGISPELFTQVIPQCAGTSWMLENRAPHVAAGDYTAHSAVDIWPKDLGIALSIAHGAQFSAPITAAALQQFLAASGMGLGHEDDAAVAKVYARNARLTLPGDD